MQKFENIEINPKVLGGKPVFKNTRIPIALILHMIRDGVSFDQIIQEYPRLSVENIKSAIDYAVYMVNNPEDEIVMLN